MFQSEVDELLVFSQLTNHSRIFKTKFVGECFFSRESGPLLAGSIKQVSRTHNTGNAILLWRRLMKKLSFAYETLFPLLMFRIEGKLN